MRGVSVENILGSSSGSKASWRGRRKRRTDKRKNERTTERTTVAHPPQFHKKLTSVPPSRPSEEDHRPNHSFSNHRPLRQEDRRYGSHQDGHKVQDPMLSVLVHLVPRGFGKGRKVEVELAPWYVALLLFSVALEGEYRC